MIDTIESIQALMRNGWPLNAFQRVLFESKAERITLETGFAWVPDGPDYAVCNRNTGWES